MPLQATSGAASYDAFGGGVPVVPNYIEDVFSTWLRVSDGTNTQSVVNNIDLSTKGGLVWSKPRAAAGENHIWVDSARGVNKYLSSDLTGAQGTMTYPYTFNTNGYTVGNGNFWANGVSLVDWCFRKQPKFFDVVTYTGNGTTQNIAHNLGSVPGCIIVKTTSNAGYNWAVYHRSLSSGDNLRLNTTDSSSGAALGPGGFGDNTSVVAPTSTVFTVGNNGNLNNSGFTYVAYLFAHNAGGFGLTGTDNVISCGSYTGTGSPLSVTLGYEPQWILVKRTSTAGNDWILMDTMRGMSLTDASWLNPNTSAAESTGLGQQCNPTATGFDITSTGSNLNAGGATYIYIAIRRGPMKVPTDATKVYETGTQLSTSPSFVSGFPVDLAMRKYTGISDGWNQVTRLQGTATLGSDSTAAETTGVTPFTFDYQTGWSKINSADSGIRSWMFRRAPSFMDVVCYTGDGYSAQDVKHNLNVVPELVFLKSRSATGSWYAGCNFGNSSYSKLQLQSTAAAVSGSYNASIDQISGKPTSSNLQVAYLVNTSSATYVAYLFATCAGVSKVGSYTGNGSTQTIDCGFGAGGVRFVIIKRTDSTGGWYLYDTARGMTVLTDPYLFLNTADAQTATLGSVTTVSTGFAVNAAVLAAINTNAASYIFLAIA